MTYLIGLNGRRGAGKDTAFRFLNDWAAERSLSAHRRGFADSLKLSFARLFIPNISVEEAVIWCDELKQDADIGGDPSFLSIAWSRIDDHYTETKITHTITGRQALQRYGTESHRDVFGENFWVDALLPTVAGDEDGLMVEPWAYNFRGPLEATPPDIAVITDIRFPNEAERVRKLGGKVWEIKRTNLLTEDTHSSERPLPEDLIDRTLKNYDGDMQVLRAQVRHAAEEDIPL